MTDFTGGVLSAIKEFDMLPSGSRVLVCLSGGADSVSLLSALYELKDSLSFELFAAHYNHRLRGGESDGDETFCREVCDKLGVPLFVGSGDVSGEAQRRSQGIEECARDMRYAFFYETAARIGGARIATAHTADDNLETVLMRIARGTGLKGLCGIPPVRGDIIRPLIYLRRRDVEEYLSSRGLSHREDSTNAEDGHFRNIIRHRVIPALSEYGFEPSAQAAEMTRLLREDESFLEDLADDFIKTHPVLKASELSALPFSLSSRVLRKAAGRDLSAEHVRAVLDLAGSGGPSDSLDLPGVTVRREYDSILFGKAEELSFEPFAISPGDSRDVTSIGLRISAAEELWTGEINKSFTELVFKSDTVCDKILIRPRKTGDFIRLSPSSGQKSLKKLYIERKIPAHRRSAVPVVSDGCGVLGVCGIGTDLRSRARKGDNVIKITFAEIK